MKTKRKTSVLIPAEFEGEVSPDDAVAALAFYVLKITLYAKSINNQKAIAEERNAYFIDAKALREATLIAKTLGWGVELDVAEMGVLPPAQPVTPVPPVPPVGTNFPPVVTVENLLDALMAEYAYWRDSDGEVAPFASGAVANVIAFATVENWRAEWHPEKKPAIAKAETGPWSRFMFRLADGSEQGHFGLILADLLLENGVPAFVEPWPGQDIALYVKDTPENVASVMQAAKKRALTPIGVLKTEAL